MTEFSPGPWRVTGDNIRSDNHPDGTGALLFTTGPMFRDYNPVPEEIAANLTLAAAAPDLLAALEEIAKPDGLTEASAGTMVFEDLTSKKQIARAAIAKARDT